MPDKEYSGRDRRIGQEGMVVPLREHLEKEITHVKADLAREVADLRSDLHNFRAESAQDHATVLSELTQLKKQVLSLQSRQLQEMAQEKGKDDTYKKLAGIILGANTLAVGIVTTIFLIIDKT